MIGFTVVLNKRKRHSRKKEKNRRKIFYFLPVILIAVFSVFVSFFLKEDGTADNINYAAEDIQVFKTVDDYSAYYNPIVMNGFFSYKKGEEIESEMLVSLAVWSILSTEETEKYEVFDGKLSIKKDEVEERVRMLFSEKVSFENLSSGEIIFDKNSGCYIIPTMGFSPEYSPVLESVKAEKEKVKLTVGCLKSESFKQDSSGKTVLPEAEKSIVITLAKDENSYYIESVSEE